MKGGLAEAGGLALLLGVGWFSAVLLGARLVKALSSQVLLEPPAAARAIQRLSIGLPFTWLALAALAAPFGVAYDGELGRGLRGLSLASVGVGSFALAMRQGLPGHLCFLANGAATIAAAAAMALARGESYSSVVKRALGGICAACAAPKETIWLDPREPRAPETGSCGVLASDGHPLSRLKPCTS